MSIQLGKIIKWFFLAILIVILAYLIALFVLQIPSVQTRTVHVIQRSLSKSIGTEVSVERVALKFFDNYRLEGLYIEGADKKPLLLVDYADVKVDWSLWDLLRKKITLEKVILRTGDVNIYRLEDGCPNTVFKKYVPKKEKILEDPAFTVIFDPALFQLSNINVYESDWSKERKMHISVPQAEAKLNRTDFANHFEISSLRADGLEFTFVRDKISESTATKCDLLEGKVKKETNLYIKVDDIEISNSRFRFDNNYRKPYNYTDGREVFDLGHFDLYDLNINSDLVEMRGDSIMLNQGQIRVKEKGGFEIKTLDFGHLDYLPKEILLKDFEMVTKNSVLKNNFSIKFNSIDDLEEIGNKSKLNITFDDIKLGVKDVMYFAPTLYDDAVFNKLKSKYIEFDGVLKGKPNNIIAKNFLLGISNEIKLVGDLNAKDLLEPDNAYLSVIIDHLDTDMNTLLHYFPQLEFTSGMSQLGRLNLQGMFKGYLQNWTTHGELSTDLGELDLDLQMNLETQEYEGSISTPSFDLGTLIATDDLGIISAKLSVDDGKNFAPKEFSANVNGHVNRFDFQDYSFTNADLKGSFKHNTFDGIFFIEDPNVDLDFNGHIEFSDLTKFEFQSNIEKADLGAIGLVDQDLVLKGLVNMKIDGEDFNNLNGSVFLDGFRYANETVPLDSLSIDIKSTANNQKNIRFDSKDIHGKILGELDLINIVPDVFRLLEYYEPNLYSSLQLKPQSSQPISTYNFTFSFEADSVATLLEPFVDSLDRLSELLIDGKLTYDKSKLDYFINFSSESIHYKNIVASNIKLLSKSQDDDSRLSLKSDTLYVGTVELFKPNFNTHIFRDSFAYDLMVQNINNTIDTVFFSGNLNIPEKATYYAHLDSSSFRIRNKIWTLDPKNSVALKPEYLFLDNIVYSNSKSNLYLQSVTSQSLIAGTRNLDAYFLNAFTQMPNMKINGEMFTTVAVENVFDLEGFEIDLSLENLKINEDQYSTLQFNGYLIDFTKPINLKSTLTALDGEDILKGGGKITPINGLEKLDFDLLLNTHNLPLSTVEYVLGNIVSDSRGTLESNITYQGTTPDAELKGLIDVNGSTKLTMLGTNLGFEDQEIIITRNSFDFPDLNLTDSEGNTASVNGKVTHNNFQDMRLDLNAKSNLFKIMDLANSAGNLFYGKAYASLDLDITGPVEQLNVSTSATSASGTDIYLPLNSGTASQTTFFYDIVDSTETLIQSRTGYSSLDSFVYNYGINLDINLNVLPNARVAIIIDESTGDQIQGTGTGEVNINLSRAGELSINGNYTINQGTYNFSQGASIISISKVFELEPGGQINWTGDPVDATIDITAKYHTRTSPENLISEYLVSESSQAEARNVTDVDLKMKLQNRLLHPDISFDLSFPDLTGELKNFTNQKMAQLQQNDAELNAQAMSLLVRNQFKSSGDSFTFDSDIIFNSLTEMLTSYLSQFLSDAIFQELFADSKLVTDFNIDNRYIIYNSSDRVSPSQVQNDRTQYYETSFDLEFVNKYDFTYILHADIGGAYGNQWMNDFIFKIPLREDKSVAVTVYSKDARYFNERRNKVGTGLIFSRSFNTFPEFLGRKETPNTESDQ